MGIAAGDSKLRAATWNNNRCMITDAIIKTAIGDHSEYKMYVDEVISQVEKDEYPLCGINSFINEVNGRHILTICADVHGTISFPIASDLKKESVEQLVVNVRWAINELRKLLVPQYGGDQLREQAKAAKRKRKKDKTSHAPS